MLRERNQSFKLIFIFLDLILSVLAFTTSVVIHFYIMAPEKRLFPETSTVFPKIFFDNNPEMFLLGNYVYLGILISVVQVLVLIATDLYHPRRGYRFLKEFLSILKGVVLAVGVVLALLFFYRNISYSRLVILYSMFFSLLYLTVGHYIFRAVLAKLRAKGYNIRHVLVLGTDAAAERIQSTLSRHAIYGYRIIGFVGDKKSASPKIKPLVQGTLRNIKKITEKLNPDLLIYALPHDQVLMRKFVQFTDHEGLDFRIVLETIDIVTHRARIEDIDGIPILTIRDIPLKNGYNRFLKRSFDILFSGTIMLLSSPLFLLLALLVKLDSRGPVFFMQERVGLDRKIFKVYKFRTMHIQKKSESDTTWGSQHDTRVTKIGKLLRHASLDELPQFLNVFLGDMSVVGPRPERPHFVKEFKSKYDHYMRRHSVKTGITGWAQIQGLRGDTSISKRIEADIYYIENWTFWLDIMIILKTIPALIKNPGE